MTSSPPSVISPIQNSFFQPTCTTSDISSCPKSVKVIATELSTGNNFYYTTTDSSSTPNCKKLSITTNTIVSQIPPISNISETGLDLQLDCSKNAILINNNKNRDFICKNVIRTKKFLTEQSIPEVMKETNFCKPKPFTRRISQTGFLFVPEQRRISTASGSSVVSCPTELENKNVETEEFDRFTEPYNLSIININNNNTLNNSRKLSQAAQVASAAYTQMYGSGGVGNNRQIKHLFKDRLCSSGSISNCGKNSTNTLVNLPNFSTNRLSVFGNSSAITSPESIRRRSIQAAAPAIAFRSTNAMNFNNNLKLVTHGYGLTKNKKCFERRSSQPTISINLNNMTYNQHKNSSASSINFMKRGSATATSYLYSNIGISPLVQKNHTNYCLVSTCENKGSHCSCNTNCTPKSYTPDCININSKWNYYSPDNNDSQDTIITSTKIPIKNSSLTKRVSWYWKSLQNVAEPLLDLTRTSNRDNIDYQRANIITKNFCLPEYALRSDSRTNSQIGSILQLNDEPYDLEADTPPMDTMSWSNMGKTYCFYLAVL